MEFDEIVVKESPGLCRCCLSEGCYKDMGSEYNWMSENEVYADMLLECFDISISQHNEGPNGPNRLICEVCITRLRDACNFKKQVLDSEKKFVDMIGRGEFRPKVLIYQAHMKSEDVEVPIDDAEVEYLEDDIDFGEDDMHKTDDLDPSLSEDIPLAALPRKSKRGRPKKTSTIVKMEKKKVAKLEEKAKSSKALVKGLCQDAEAASKSSISTTKRNRLMKRNAIIILENTSAVPFKWHRQNYLCFYCHKDFKEPQILKEHTKDQHGNANIKAAVSYIRRDEKVKIDVTVLACKLCQYNAENLDAIVNHIKDAHNKTFAEDYGIGLIPYRFDNENFQCAICQKSFQYFIKLNQHMNEHYGNYVCELCGKSFLSRDRLRCHSLCHRSGFSCNVCSETFGSLTQKLNHEYKVHNVKKMLKCCYCNEMFSNYGQRKRHHNMVHDVETPMFKCPVCGKIFHIMSRMEVHLKEVHIRERNFSCVHCDHKFFSRTLLKRHMIKHCGNRVHQCEVCMKSYARKQTLRDHMKIHNDEKRFICSVCSQAFVQNNSLRLHMRVHHPDSESA